MRPSFAALPRRSLVGGSLVLPRRRSRSARGRSTRVSSSSVSRLAKVQLCKAAPSSYSAAGG
eukprot:401843-Prymnesium_polylepis.1